MSTDTTTYYVYILCREDGRVLYVGCTSSLTVRFRHHASLRPWWSEVRHMEWRVVQGKRAALDEEQRLTQLLRPVHAACLADVHPAVRGWAQRQARRERHHADGLHCDVRGCRYCREHGLTRYATYANA